MGTHVFPSGGMCVSIFVFLFYITGNMLSTSLCNDSWTITQVAVKLLVSRSRWFSSESAVLTAHCSPVCSWPWPPYHKGEAQKFNVCLRHMKWTYVHMIFSWWWNTRKVSLWGRNCALQACTSVTARREAWSRGSICAPTVQGRGKHVLDPLCRLATVLHAFTAEQPTLAVKQTSETRWWGYGVMQDDDVTSLWLLTLVLSLAQLKSGCWCERMVRALGGHHFLTPV